MVIQVSIFSPSGKAYYLNITQSNIIQIISPNNDRSSSPDQLLITKADIDKIIFQCSEIPKIVFDPKTAFVETKSNQPSPSPIYTSHNHQQHKWSPATASTSLNQQLNQQSNESFIIYRKYK